MLRVTRSQSTNTGLAPSLDDHVENGEEALAPVITSSPGPMPQSCNATSIAAVAEVSTRTGRPPQNADKLVLEALHPRSAGDLAGAQHVRDAGDGRLVEHRAGEFEIAHSRLV